MDSESPGGSEPSFPLVECHLASTVNILVLMSSLITSRAQCVLGWVATCSRCVLTALPLTLVGRTETKDCLNKGGLYLLLRKCNVRRLGLTTFSRQSRLRVRCLPEPGDFMS